MKFTKLIAASFAALAMFSCSKEAKDADQPMVKPGDARYVLTLNKGSQTTYATGGQEQAIKSLIYAVYDNNGNEVRITDNKGGVAKVDFTVASTDYANLANKNVTLCILANSTITTAPTTLAAFELLKEGSNPNSDVAKNGLVAYKKVSIDLATNVDNVVTNATVLDRGVARFWVKASAGYTRTNIKDAVIEITKTSDAVTLFTGVGSGTPTVDTYTYEIKGETAPTLQYKDQESAFYAYPTAMNMAEIKVTLGGKTVSRPVSADMVANKNYSITITPKIDVVSGIEVVEDVSITEWNITDGDDFTVDFNEYNKAGFIAAGFKVMPDGTFVVEEQIGGGLILGQPATMTLVADAFGAGMIVEKVTYTPATRATTATDNDIDGHYSADYMVGVLVDKNKKSDIYISVLPNTTGADIKGNMIFNLKNTSSNVTSQMTIPYIIKNIEYGADFTVMYNGLEWMQINSVGSSVADNKARIADIKKINLGTFAEQYAEYARQNPVVSAGKVAATDFASWSEHCPAGFVIPSMEQLRSLLNITTPPPTSGTTSLYLKNDGTTTGAWNGVDIAFERTGVATVSTGTGNQGFAQLTYGGVTMIIPWHRADVVTTSAGRLAAVLSSSVDASKANVQRLLMGINVGAAAPYAITQILFSHQFSAATATRASVIRCVKDNRTNFDKREF